jgi:hypothetical protein
MERNGPEQVGKCVDHAHHVTLNEVSKGMHYLFIEALGFMSIVE